MHSADFLRLRSAPTWSRSAHFAVQHLPVGPHTPRRRVQAAIEAKLSTGEMNNIDPVVDNSPPEPPKGHWLGTVLPKRLARRAVTRNLLRRQIRGAMQRHLNRLPPGLWVVRLRSPFTREQYPSAASDALRGAARQELDRLLGDGAP